MTKVKKIIICVVAAVVAALAVVFGIVFAPKPNKEANDDFTFSVVQTSLSLEVGQTETLHFNLSSNDASVTFTSSNPAVATIDNDTLIVSAISAGTATIQGVATLNNKAKFSNCVVTVTESTSVLPMPQSYFYSIDIQDDGISEDEADKNKMPLGANPPVITSSEDAIGITFKIWDKDGTQVQPLNIHTSPEQNSFGPVNQNGIFVIIMTEGDHLDIFFEIDGESYQITISYQKL